MKYMVDYGFMDFYVKLDYVVEGMYEIVVMDNGYYKEVIY